MSYQLGAEMVNFGAFLAFSGVNLACIQYERRNGFPRGRAALWLPLLGLIVNLYIWANLRWQAKLAGAIWVAAGLAYVALRRREPRR